MTLTRSQELIKDVSALLRSRAPLLWIISREEARVEAALIDAAANAGYLTRTWDVAQGARDMLGAPSPQGIGSSQDPGNMLDAIAQRAQKQVDERCVWILRDLPAWLAGPIGAATSRKLRNLARLLPGIRRESAQALVILTPSSDVPPELADHATVLDWPLPDRTEIAAALDAALEAGGAKVQQPTNGDHDAAVDAAVGLSHQEAAACYARSLVQHRRIDVATVAREKKRVIARERVLEWYDPLPGGLDMVGGLENLKTWLRARAQAYSPQARAYGLPTPKGCLLAGISGCGKSMTAKAIATAWNVPLLRLDFGALKSKYVGDSEGLIRKAFKVVEAIGRCVLWLDEIEKALQGATSNSADGGVSTDALGTTLTWMQERQGEAFVVATANDIEGLPPELLRKGRFDEIWWIELPTLAERVAILGATLRTYTLTAMDLDLCAVAEACVEFTGAELAALVPDAMFAAFADGSRPLTTEDLLVAAETVVPLAKTQAEKLTRLRQWAKGRARLATVTETPKALPGRRTLDL